MTHPASIMKGADAQVSLALISYQDERRGRPADDQERLFKARIETSEISQIGEMLAVAINDGMRDSELFHSGAQVVDSCLQLGGGWRGWAGGHTEFRPVDFDQAVSPRCGGQADIVAF